MCMWEAASDVLLQHYRWDLGNVPGRIEKLEKVCGQPTWFSGRHGNIFFIKNFLIHLFILHHSWSLTPHPSIPVPPTHSPFPTPSSPLPWKHILNWASFLSDDFRLCQVDITYPAQRPYLKIKVENDRWSSTLNSSLHSHTTHMYTPHMYSYTLIKSTILFKFPL